MWRKHAIVPSYTAPLAFLCCTFMCVSGGGDTIVQSFCEGRQGRSGAKKQSGVVAPEGGW